MVIGNTPQAALLGQAIQAQVKEGGFDLELVPTEFAASLDQTDAGNYQMFQIGWSGRVDPDGNIANFVAHRGLAEHQRLQQPTVDALIDQARAEPDVAARRDLYGQVITQLHQDLPLIYLYRQKNFTGVAQLGGRRAGVRRRPAPLRHRRLRRLTRDRGGRLPGRPP